MNTFKEGKKEEECRGRRGRESGKKEIGGGLWGQNGHQALFPCYCATGNIISAPQPCCSAPLPHALCIDALL